jgi:hypothetical protein
MKAFGIGIVVAIALAIRAAIGLSFVQETVDRLTAPGTVSINRKA